MTLVALRQVTVPSLIIWLFFFFVAMRFWRRVSRPYVGTIELTVKATFD